MSLRQIIILLVVGRFSSGSDLVPPTKHRCHGEAPHPTCTFINLCYRTPAFIYMTNDRDSDGFRSLPKIQLGAFESSATFAVEGQERSDFSGKTTWIREPTFLLHRTHTANYMHALVDDYLGLFHMLEHYYNVTKGTMLDPSEASRRILTVDGKPEHERERFIDLQHVFGPHTLTSLEVYFKDQTTPNSLNTVVCFEALTVGPGRRHVGGPGQVRLEPSFVARYVHFIAARLDVADDAVMAHADQTTVIITLIHRDDTRQVLNEQELISRIQADHRNVHIEVKRMADLSLKDQVVQILRSKVLMGMHGAGLANAIFLRPNSLLFEMFPWGVKRPIYQFIIRRLKTNVNYVSWENTNQTATVLRPDVIQNWKLSRADRELALSSPEAITRSMAANLYWLSQDTVVNVKSISSVLTIELRSLSDQQHTEF